MEQQQEGILAEYAGFWMRLGAYLIDGIILGVISSFIWTIGSIIGLIAGLAAIGGGGEEFFDVASLLVNVVYIVIGIINFIIGVAYFVCFWKWRGQTPGKMALGIRVIRTDGSSIGWGRALLRYLGYIVSTIILLIGSLWIAFDGRKQGVHDKIADTYVVRLPRRRVRLPETYG